MEGKEEMSERTLVEGSWAGLGRAPTKDLGPTLVRWRQAALVRERLFVPLSERLSTYMTSSKWS